MQEMFFAEKETAKEGIGDTRWPFATSPLPKPSKQNKQRPPPTKKTKESS